MSELSAATVGGKPLFPTDPHDPNSLKLGGYKIVTTIDKTAQDAAIKNAGRTDPSSPMAPTAKWLGASLTMVQPGTGRVLAYYGGENGSGIDRAGIYNDPVLSNPGWTGRNQPPGSSFKTVTMATALQQGLSVNSWWWGPNKYTDKTQGRPVPVSNAG